MFDFHFIIMRTVLYSSHQILILSLYIVSLKLLSDKRRSYLTFDAVDIDDSNNVISSREIFG